MPKLLFLVTEDWVFWSHRLLLAREAQRSGYEVVVATRVSRHGERIRAEGFKLVPIGMQRRSLNPLRELFAIRELVAIYRQEKPDIVHHVALKSVVYGSLAARLAPAAGMINTLTGLGYVFSSRQLKARLLRPLIVFLLRFCLRQRDTVTIFQNPDDLNLLVQAQAVCADDAVLIRGSGVDMLEYLPLPEPEGTPVVVFASRMVWDKGVGEFVAAAGMLRQNGVHARFVLVGDTDAENPACVPPSQLQQWHASGVVEWWGKMENMPPVFAASHVVCLPSAYGEGVPKVLIEAAASGRPIVTTDAPGCREIVRHGHNGLLVPVRDVPALAAALQQLVEDRELRHRMGHQGRELAVNEFSAPLVIRETMNVYRRFQPPETAAATAAT